MPDAQAGDLDAQNALAPGWIHTFLNGPGGNRELSEGLLAAPRWWRGVLQLPLATLARCCGPEPEMEYPQDRAGWENRVSQLVESLESGVEFFPLIVEYRAGELSVRDGNHRAEAYRRLGRPDAPVMVWYNSRADFERHGARIAASLPEKAGDDRAVSER